MEGAVEGHFMPGLVACHGQEAALVGTEGQGELLIGFIGQALAGTLAEIGDAGAKSGGLHLAGTAGTPGAVDELVDQSPLGVGGGLEVGQDAVAKRLELVLFFDGNDEVGAGQAVFEGIEAGAGLAFGGAGAATVGVGGWVLRLGHEYLPTSMVREGCMG
jgi:hypothetical protein